MTTEVWYIGMGVAGFLWLTEGLSLYILKQMLEDDGDFEHLRSYWIMWPARAFAVVFWPLALIAGAIVILTPSFADMIRDPR